LPRRCSICDHERIEEINLALVQGTALSEIAALFRASPDALSRHRTNHLPASILRAEETREMANAKDLLSHIKDLHCRTLAILKIAEAKGDGRTALSAIREGRGNLEFVGKLYATADQRDRETAASEEFQRQVQWFGDLLVKALGGYPEAREVVVQTMNSSLENAVERQRRMPF
jgi:hypothetical protein